MYELLICIRLTYNLSSDIQEYYLTQDVPDPEIMVAFPVLGDPQNAAFVAWTTTPWTLPSNLALCVNANFVYVKVRLCKFMFNILHFGSN